MYFSVNYSYSASLLLQAGRITIDCWKLFEDERLVREAAALKPVRVHFSYQAGSGDAFHEDRIRTTEELLKISSTLTVNTHLAVRGNPSEQEYVERVGRDIEELIRIFGRDLVIAENVFPQGISSHPGADPWVISNIINSHSIGFLFDIGHAKLAAAMRAEEIYAYISSLPLKSVREVHISGTKIDPASGVLTDHYPMTEHDYELVEWVFDLVRGGMMAVPELIAVEMGGVGGQLEDRVTLHDLAEALPRLHSSIYSTAQRKAA